MEESIYDEIIAKYVSLEPGELFPYLEMVKVTQLTDNGKLLQYTALLPNALVLILTLFFKKRSFCTDWEESHEITYTEDIHQLFLAEI